MSVVVVREMSRGDSLLGEVSQAIEDGEDGIVYRLRNQYVNIVGIFFNDTIRDLLGKTEEEVQSTISEILVLSLTEVAYTPAFWQPEKVWRWHPATRLLSLKERLVASYHHASCDASEKEVDIDTFVKSLSHFLFLDN